MATPDIGHKLTEEELKRLESRIASVYDEAAEDLRKTIDEYFKAFAKRDARQLDKLKAGEITEEDYKQWRLNQIGRGERFEALRDKAAERATRANETAISYVNDATPGIYSLNRNYAAYTIERVAGNVGFTLWDEQTVRRLAVKAPDLMPYYPEKRAIQRGFDLAYGKKQITASVTSNILQGKSIKGIADDLQKRIVTMSRESAVRAARTSVTGAQNAGRVDSYTAAQKMGIKLQKEWLATLDNRTRHSHAMLDGQKIDNDKKFSNGCMFPGDPSGPPSEVYNCRCTLVAAVEGVDTSDAQRRARNPETGRNEVVSDMTFAQWEASKRVYGAKPISTIRDKESVEWRKSLQNKENVAILKEKIATGEYSTKLSVQQQSKHIQGTKQFEQYLADRRLDGRNPQSILTITKEQAQELIDRYAGTGTVKLTKKGKPTNKEFVTTDGVVGKYFEGNTFIPTKRIAIHYGKRNSHIVPVKEEYDG